MRTIRVESKVLDIKLKGSEPDNYFPEMKIKGDRSI